MKAWLLQALAVIALAAPVASADPVYGTSADSNGSRTLLNMQSSGYSRVDLTWSVVDNGDNTFLYTYEFAVAGPDISHFILDLTDSGVLPLRGNLPNDPDILTDAEVNGLSFTKLVYGTFGADSSNPGLPAGREIVGVKFDDLGDDSLVYSFTSNRAPVWGDFYIKGGQSYAYNNGLASPLSENVLDFIARPNGIVPEPSSVVLIVSGLGLLGLACARRNPAN